MKTIRTVRLGRWLPVLLLVCMSVFWSMLSLVEYHLWKDRVQDHGIAEVRDELIRLQRAMSHQLRKSNWSAAEQALTWPAVKPALAIVAALDESGTILLATRFDWKGRPATQVLANLDPADLGALHGQGAPIIRPIGHNGHIVGYAAIDIDEEGALRPLRKGTLFIDYDPSFEQAQFWREFIHKSAVFGTASLVLAGLMLWLLRELVSLPLARLTEAVRRVERGEPVVDARLTGAGELADLGRAFENMSQTLLQNLAALRTESQRNALLLRTASDGIHIIDEGGRLVQASDSFFRMLGYAPEEILGAHVAQWDAQWTRPELEVKIRELLGSSAIFETWHRRKDGSLMDVEVSAADATIGDQRLLYCSSRDISTRKTAERTLRESEARFRELSDAAPVLIWMAGLEPQDDYRNRDWLEFTGRSLKQERGGGWMEGVHPEDKAHCLEAYRRAFNTHEPFRVEYRLRRHDGEYRWLIDTGRPRFDGQSAFLGFIGSCIDITEMKQAELELQLAALTFETHEAIIITDGEGRIQRANQAYCRMTGYAREEVIGKPGFTKTGLENEALYESIWEALPRDGVWQGEAWSRRKSGEVHPIWLSITAVRDKSQDITHYVGAFIDITQQKEAEERIRQLAYYDTLTGLPNRRLLYDRLQRSFTAAAQLGQYGALLFIDLDNFKLLNDTAGHDIGDQLLIQVAETLSRTVRVEDTVARLGGDEFVIVLERLGGTELEAASRARRIAEKVIAAMGQPYALAGREHHVTLSIGVALFHGDEGRPESFLKRADAAMYQAKATGRNSACFFDPKMAAAMAERVALLTELRKASGEGQFRLYCQPLVDGEDRLAGAEVLLRWRHPERGWVEPSEFIPLAEESGLISLIGTWVLNGACELLRAWEDTGWLPPDFFLAINISPRQFRQTDFARAVRSAVTRTGIAAHRLKLEITEGILISGMDDTVTTLNELRALGIRFALDDFGTGYSSLAYLQRLPLDQLKIDRSFVLGLSRNPHDATIIKTIISMGRSLGLEVVAEGVETRTQFEFLKAHGCRLFQGYLFSVPIEANQFGEQFWRGNAREDEAHGMDGAIAEPIVPPSCGPLGTRRGCAPADAAICPSPMRQEN